MFIRNSLKRYVYIAFALIILMISWEYNTSNAALTGAVIPEESIRLRILANSDSARDQWIKRKVRDEIIKHMNQWIEEPEGIEAARKQVELHLPDFEQLVGDILHRYGFENTYSAELAVVDFPTKIYGKQVYPAGDYEALRIVIGAGKGENWWCVLFPPLCFVDLVTSVTIDPETEDSSGGESIAADDSGLSAEDPEIRFFLWDLLKSVGSFIKGLFA